MESAWLFKHPFSYICNNMSPETDKNKDSALKVQQGVEKPSSVNPALAQGMGRFKKDIYTIPDYLKGILEGDRGVLSRAITLVESALPNDQAVARELINLCLPHSGKALRLGITGVPGAGKSTFIESFGLQLIEKGYKIAVLAIDPSSKRSKGSILGDKTRMEDLSVNPHAFIRPSATAGTLGGVARKTRETVILCEASGFDLIMIETVGVGQSETSVAQIVDFFILLQLAGGGDELQGIKRGIMEMADLIVINKADGDNIKKAAISKRDYENALHLFPALPNKWMPQVVTASALHKTGLEVIWEKVSDFVKLTKENGHFEGNRQTQALDILTDSITHSLTEGFFYHPEIMALLKVYEQQVLANQISPYEAAQILLAKYYELIR